MQALKIISHLQAPDTSFGRDENKINQWDTVLPTEGIFPVLFSFSSLNDSNTNCVFHAQVRAWGGFIFLKLPEN